MKMSRVTVRNRVGERVQETIVEIENGTIEQLEQTLKILCEKHEKSAEDASTNPVTYAQGKIV